MVTSAISGWSGTHLEYPLPGPWGRFPAITGLKVFVAGLQGHGRALSSSGTDRTSGSVTVSDHLQALMGASDERSGCTPGWDGLQIRPFLPSGGLHFSLLGLGRGCSTESRWLGLFLSSGNLTMNVGGT